MVSVSDKKINIAILRLVYITLFIPFLALSYICNAYFIAGCSICSILFSLIQYRLVLLSRKDKSCQEQKCKSIGFMLLLPALGMIANGIALIFLPDAEMPINLHYAAIAVLAVATVGLSAHIFIFRNDSSIAARFLRFTDCAALSVPIPQIVLLALSLSNDESAMEMGCMSAVLFGVMSLLMALNMILTSLFDYTTTRESIRAVSILVHGKKLIFFRAVVIKDGFLVAGKLLISLVSLSFFMFVNGLYSVGMGAGRFIAIKMHGHSREEQIKDYRRIGGIILFSSVCYVLYSVRLFFGGKSAAFPMIIAIAIAFYTFIEFGVNIREIIRLRKSEALEAKALRALSFSSTLLSFVLTQTAIMSFTYEGDTNFSNALSGIVFGGMAALVGLYVLVSTKYHHCHVQ